MTAPLTGGTRPRSLEDFWNYLERLQNGVLPFLKLIVRGPIATALVRVTAAYTILETDSTVVADATGAAFAVTLPTAAGIRKGREYLVKRLNAGANNVTVTAAGAETIDGAATVALVAQYAFLRVQSDGSNWHKVG